MKSRSHHHHRLQSSDPPDDWVNGSWTVDCSCGVNFDDGEEMVNCDECGVWVHTRCSRYVKGDDMFVCDKCKIKNNRNNSEETEVAQFLVELPTKTVRVESSYGGASSYGRANGPSRRPPLRLWTDIPIEDRVHVQGKPGGDPSMFAGLSSVFTPELWKCTGHVPKKFNFRYREFPCWDEKEGDGKMDEENENPVDKGAGVLFSLSKESVVSAPMAGLVEKVGRDRRKLCLKERKKWNSEGSDCRRVENCGKKENGLVRAVVAHSGKRKKEDSGMSKDWSGRKKPRAAEKDVDARKRATHSSKAVFTPTSDAKRLEERAAKFPKGEVQSTKNKNSRETVAKEPTSDSHLADPCNEKNHCKATSSSDMAAEDCVADEGPKEDKVGPHHRPQVPESSPKTNDAVCSVDDHDNARKMHVKEEGTGMEAVDKSVGDAHVKDVSKAVESKESTIQDSIGDLSVKSEQPNIEVKKENLDNSPGPLLKVQSPSLGDAKDPGMSSDHVSETHKLTGKTVVTSGQNDHKASIPDRSLESATDSHVNIEASHWPDDLLESELEGTESLMALHNSPAEKHGSGLSEEHSKLGGISSNPHGLSSQRKLTACNGKSSVSCAALIPKSSSFDNVKSTEALNRNPVAKAQHIHDGSNATVRKDRASHDSRDDNPRKTMKDRPKLTANPIPKPLNSSKMSYDSLPKKATAESKENPLSVSSKTHLTTVIAGASSGTTEHVSLLHQKATHTNNRNSTSASSQKGEKPNQPNLQAPSKIHQNQTPSVCPSIPSSSPPALSDEELALLLHQELNSSPRVPRVPRMRHAGGNLPQIPSPTATTMLMKRTSSSGAKDHSSVPRRKYRDASRDGFRSSREASEDVKQMDRGSTSHDMKRRDTDYSVEVSTKREDNGSLAMESAKKSAPSTSAATNSGPSSSNETNDRNLSSVRHSPRNASDEDTSMVGGPVHRTLPALINEIMSEGRRMTYEELCNSVLPHWHNLRKHNGERYAYTSHSQAVLDCLRNRNEWARLVDRGPKTTSTKKRRKHDADDSEDNDYGKGKASNQVESKSLESQKDDYPKGKRKARKRRRLALHGKGIKDIRKKRKQDRFTDDDFATSSNSSEESTSSAEDVQGNRAHPDGSEASSSSDEGGEM